MLKSAAGDARGFDGKKGYPSLFADALVEMGSAKLRDVGQTI